MKTLATTVFLLFSISMAQAQTRIDAVMTVDSVERQYIISVPTGPAPTGGYPLVFVFHGTSQDGEKFWLDSQWKETGDTGKFITVFPNALEYYFYDNGLQRKATKWHAGELEDMACPGQFLKNDVTFVRAMIDSITARFLIDRQRIYATGFSNGACFTSKLAVEMSDVFAAVGVSGGGIGGRDSAAVLRPIPVWFVLGTLDDIWLEAYEPYGLTEFPFNDSCLMWLSRPLHRFLACFNLADAYVKTEAGRIITYRYTTPLPGTAATEFRVTLINDMYHVYPDGSNVPLKAAVVFWNFFQQFTTPLHAGFPSRAPEDITMYPSPAHEYLRMEGARDADFVLRNLLGQELLRMHIAGGSVIRLPRLAAGVYIAEIATDGRRVAKTIAIR